MEQGEERFMRYLLLPFTHGIDGLAITYALSLASQREAVLVLLAVLRSDGRKGKQAVRPEEIQQANDFLVYTQQRAVRIGVPICQAQIHTASPAQSIRAFAREMDCEGIILFVRGGKGVLLDTYDIKRLLEDLRMPLFVAKLPRSRISLPGWWPRWLGGRAG
jgi:hypothetical protein